MVLPSRSPSTMAILAATGLIMPSRHDGTKNTRKTCVAILTGHSKSRSASIAPTRLLSKGISRQLADAIRKIAPSVSLGGNRSARRPPA